MNPLSELPQIEIILNDPSVSNWATLLSRPIVANIARDILGGVRTDYEKTGTVPESGEVILAVASACETRARRCLRRVINATGVIVHTNLGRSPIRREVWRSAEELNVGYTNLELDLTSGKRGARGGIVPDLLSALTGAESALVVNNGAAALYLVLSALANGREVVISRGEQVQIGGGFRIPEILKYSGAHLVDVGTTNVCTTSDYVEAVAENTAMALVVHASNFRMDGFTSKPLVKQIRKELPDNVLLVVDQGSGATDESLAYERSVSVCLADGADLVCFSCDKLLGGPQGGCVAGRRDLVEKLARHQLMRIIRPGKTVLSLLERHLAGILNGTGTSIVREKLDDREAEIRRRCFAVRRGVGADRIEIEKSKMAVGGGSAPGVELASWSVRFICDIPPATVTEELRRHVVPIVAVTKHDSVLLNLGTVERSDLGSIIEALRCIAEKDR